MSFVFLNQNLIQSTTQIALSSGSGTSDNLIDRKNRVLWRSTGEASDANTATISWVPGSSTIISRIVIQNHNFEDISIIFNSTPASQFAPGLSITGNALSNLYYEFASQAVNSIDINIASTHITNAEKFAGQITISNELIELDGNPTFDNYKPFKYRKGRDLEMSDGGIVGIFIAQKFRATLDLTFIPTATYDTLTAIYNSHNPFIFVPFPVDTFTTSWNGDAFNVNWTGDLTIDQFRSNVLNNGYTGQINLAETPA